MAKRIKVEMYMPVDETEKTPDGDKVFDVTDDTGLSEEGFEFVMMVLGDYEDITFELED